ncbi:MAG: SCO family protein [Lentisphaeria bacterium]|nr:SCO family protein [Lentisphaeria bacterium]NQZ69114.1 SCO family protein [Lentisphaeria bacterium]
MRFFIVSLFCLSSLSAQVVQKPDFERMRIDNTLGSQLPLELMFQDENGKDVRLGDYFTEEGHPVVIILAYYSCPGICTLVLNGFTKGLKELDWKPGEKFTVLTVSIDPTETAALAKKKQATYAEFYGHDLKDKWYFLTGKQANIAKLTDVLGFRYYYDKKRKVYVHPPAAYIFTSKGKLSRCLPKFVFTEQDLKLGLMEASEGKMGTIIDRIQSFCFHYDPNKSKYVAQASKIMTAGGVLIVIVFGTFLVLLWKKEFKKNKAVEDTA